MLIGALEQCEAELTAARARIAKLEAVLLQYAENYCEGMCAEYGPHFPDACGGCGARKALEP